MIASTQDRHAGCDDDIEGQWGGVKPGQFAAGTKSVTRGVRPGEDGRGFAAGADVAFRLWRHRSRRSDGLMPDASSASRLDRTRANTRPQLRQAPTKRSNASGCLSRPSIRGGQNEPVSARIAQVDANGHQPAVALARAGDDRNAARRTRKG